MSGRLTGAASGALRSASGGGGKQTNIMHFLANGMIDVPAWATAALVGGVSGGGSGYSTNAGRGQGGAGGTWAESVRDVVPGETLTVIVAAAQTTKASAGNTTSVTGSTSGTLISIAGATAASSSGPGTPGAAPDADLYNLGGSGGQSQNNNRSGGGGGAGTPFGVGGDGGPEGNATHKSGGGGAPLGDAESSTAASFMDNLRTDGAAAPLFGLPEILTTPQEIGGGVAAGVPLCHIAPIGGGRVTSTVHGGPGTGGGGGSSGTDPGDGGFMGGGGGSHTGASEDGGLGGAFAGGGGGASSGGHGGLGGGGGGSHTNNQEGHGGQGYAYLMFLG